MKTGITIIDGAQSTVVIDGKDHWVVRGVIHPNSLRRLKVDKYQRNAHSDAANDSLIQAFKSGYVPDVELGSSIAMMAPVGNGEFFVADDNVCIIDGQQRVNAAIKLLEDGFKPYLGATVHLGVSMHWQRERFNILNSQRTKLGTNVLLRNMAYSARSMTDRKNSGIYTLHMLSENDEEFALYKRVSWDQKMKHNDVIGAMTLIRTAGALHEHITAMGLSNRIEDLKSSLFKIQQRIGQPAFKNNVKSYYKLMKNVWHIDDALSGFRKEPQVQPVFLLTVALLLSRNLDFWDEDNNHLNLKLGGQMNESLSTFPINDPSIQNMINSGKGRDFLYHNLVEHINKGRRNKLTPRSQMTFDLLE